MTIDAAAREEAALLPDHVRLKNGALEPDILVRAIMVSLRGLLREQPIAFYALVMHCRDPQGHEFWGDMEEVLRGMGLVERGGATHGSVRNIIVSATQGDGMDMHIVDPRKESEQ